MGRNGCIAAAVVAGLSPAATASAATTVVTFAATGHDQAFTVPAGVTTLRMVAIGAAGGSGFGALAGTPGQGMQVQGDVPVAPGQILFVEVGTTPARADNSAIVPGGFNGGGTGGIGAGGGGGASDVRTVPGAASS